MADQTTFHAACHCKASKLSFTIPTSSLPLPTHFCHCSICRRTHGTLCTIHSPIPAPTVDLSTLTAYASSSEVVRYFCSTCGGHLFDNANRKGKEESWCVSTSLVDASEETWDFHSHICLEGSGDGGAAVWVPEIGGKKVAMWKMKPTDEAEFKDTGDWKPPSSPPTAARSTSEKLTARCHCGGVELHIARPRDSEIWSQVPVRQTPNDKTRWLGSVETCNSCRLVSGCSIVCWVFPLQSHITLADGSPYTPVFGTAKMYKSSEGVTRTFCGRCGAMCTYACEEQMGTVDVAAGLLVGEGARAEEWIDWRTGEVVWGEDCEWKGLLTGLEEGLKKYGEAL